MARPKRFQPPVTDKWYEAAKKLEQGYSMASVATEIGIPRHLFYRWVRAGRKGDPEYRQFALTVDRHLSVFENSMVDRVREAAADDARHAEWLLERRLPEEWAKRSFQQIEVQNQVEKLLTQVREHMSLEAYGELIRAVAHISGMDTEPAALPSAEDERGLLPAETNSDPTEIP